MQEVERVKKSVQELGLEAEFIQVDSEYYNWELEQRRQALNAPTIDHLCKTVVFENTKWTQDIPGDKSSQRYWMVIVQYTDKINSQKLNNFVRDQIVPQRPRKQFNLRVCPPEIALELTGYTPGGINPFGCTLPLIVTHNLTKLSERWIYLGAGHVDVKIKVPLDDFLTKTQSCVVDLQ
ncbi:YbaK/aminoacyl-tRNA synthetase-associated domain-containing protein [Gorgonomyces haynaldii]|nr:YbaK/aminoacyl-tRNA synthetase-associated domain-containing protein [Gorgonomyces haynaldii]